MLMFSFFFQAEDGIRDFHVTGVQTCALPISRRSWLGELGPGQRRGCRPRRCGTGRVSAARGVLCAAAAAGVSTACGGRNIRTVGGGLPPVTRLGIVVVALVLA